MRWISLLWPSQAALVHTNNDLAQKLSLFNSSDNKCILQTIKIEWNVSHTQT